MLRVRSRSPDAETAPPWRVAVMLMEVSPDEVFSGYVAVDAVSSGRLLLSQPLDRFPHRWVQLDRSFSELGYDFLAHARVPEFPQVVLDQLSSRHVLLRLEEAADLVGHVGELVRRHRRFSSG